MTMGRVFPNSPGDRGSIPGRVLTMTQKMIINAFLLNTQPFKIRIKGKCCNPWKGISPTLHLGVVAIEKRALGSPSTTVANLLTYNNKNKDSNITTKRKSLV